MPKNYRTNSRKKAMLEALKLSLGVVSTAVKQVGIDRTTHYSWMEQDEEYRKAVEDINEMAIDFVESKLFQAINNGSETAIIFYLKCKGKKRGYVQSKEITINETDLNQKPSWFDETPKS